MPTLSPAAPKRRESSARESDSKTPLLDARRLSELTGFLLCVLGLLALLSLLSYHPFDPSLNTVPAAGEPTN